VAGERKREGVKRDVFFSGGQCLLKFHFQMLVGGAWLVWCMSGKWTMAFQPERETRGRGIERNGRLNAGDLSVP